MSSIQWSRFAMYRVDPSDLDDAPDMEFPLIPGSRFRAVRTGVDEPATQINFEDFVRGPDIIWSMAHDEVHYVTQGRAEITCHLPPLLAESVTVVAEAGCVYLLPRGARITWRVLSEEPFRHLCICVPNPGYPVPLARSVERGP